MLSGDEGAWNRFMAMQADSMIPYTGVRSLLSKAITPQLKDVENDFGSYLANRNKFLFSENDVLKDMLDIYTGRPINYQEPLTAAANAMLPFFKSNGGLEPWRQWLLGTGWDNLQTVRTDPTTKEPLTPDQRQYVNNWIAQNAGLADKIEQMRSAPDKFWDQKIKEYVKERGLQKQSELPIKKMVVHEELDRIHNEAFNMAFTAYEQQNAINSMVGGYKARRDRRLGIGDIQGASSDATQVQELLQIAK
jgi:cation transport regulator ChaB